MRFVSEHAPWALESAAFRCVIAPSFARIFENNMFANGLLCIVLPKDTVDSINAERPELVVIDWEGCTVKWGNKVAEFKLSEYQKTSSETAEVSAS